jgi:hypothetical protein
MISVDSIIAVNTVNLSLFINDLRRFDSLGARGGRGGGWHFQGPTPAIAMTM